MGKKRVKKEELGKIKAEVAKKKRLTNYAVLTIAVLIIAIVFLSQYSQNGSVETGKSSQDSSVGVVTLTYPRGGETLSGVESVRWSASNTDNYSSLTVIIQYTTDPEPFCPSCPLQKWHDISTNEVNDGIYEWDTTQYGNVDNIQLKIIASNGTATVEEISDWFSISN